jgi:hypothetical protein
MFFVVSSLLTPHSTKVCHNLFTTKSLVLTKQHDVTVHDERREQKTKTWQMSNLWSAGTSLQTLVISSIQNNWAQRVEVQGYLYCTALYCTQDELVLRVPGTSRC